MSEALIRRAQAKRQELLLARAEAAEQAADARAWRNLALLLPYGVPVRPRRQLQLPTQRRPMPSEHLPSRRYAT